MIKKGEIVTCPNCGLRVAEISRDLFVGELIEETMFTWIQPPILSGQEPLCHECRASWIDFREGKIHILGRGWTF